MDTAVVFRLFLAAVLVAGNGFFVVAEFALVRVRPTRLRQLAGEGHSAAQVALHLLSVMDRVLAGTQLGVTMASLGLGWVGENTLADVLMPFLHPLFGSIAPAVGHAIALTLAFLGVTVVHIIFGELVPKNMALAHADRVAMLVARPLDLFVSVSYPAMRFVQVAATTVSHWMGAAHAGHGQVHSAEELKMLIAAGREVGLLPAAQEAMIRRVFDLDQLMVREVMVPRPDIISVPVSISKDDLLRMVRTNNFSRVPVYEDTPEKIIGVLNVKQLFRFWGDSTIPLRSLLHKPLIVPETKPLGELLEEFLAQRRQMAVVVDEFGRIAGLVTVEDVLEAVVGEIEDEFDRGARPRPTAEVKVLDLDGGTSLLDLENHYEISLPRGQGFETLAGFALWRLGNIPHVGDAFVFEQRRFIVLEMERRRIARVRIEKAPK